MAPTAHYLDLIAPVHAHHVNLEPLIQAMGQTLQQYVSCAQLEHMALSLGQKIQPSA